ncbi:MAG: S-layer homology domain-containing protein [Oscillospiraceae bacterium]|nr:S-layer homology domain-containing protein [Oscillospiraceae bacterium]
MDHTQLFAAAMPLAVEFPFRLRRIGQQLEDDVGDQRASEIPPLAGGQTYGGAGLMLGRRSYILKGEKEMRHKLQKAVSALLLLAMVLAISPMAYADSTQNFTNSETYLRTSYNNDNYVELSISENMLTVRGKLLKNGLTGLMVKCGEQSRQYIDAASGQAFSVRVSLSHSGSRPISIYVRERGENTYWSYIWDRIYVEKINGGYRIIPSLVLEQNLSFAQAYVDPDNFRDSSKVPDAVKSLSGQIVGGETDDYAKIFLLHKWVAENIYYDYDAYRSGKSTFYNSADILANKRSVCEGYANLLRDLILAQGIPCMKAATHSLGIASNGRSFAVGADNAAVYNSNHTHVEAWVDERWVIMDATWDSNNKYENGAYNMDVPIGFCYFDITPEAFSLDHKYITRANGKLKMRDGVITGTDPLTPFTDVPSWFEKEVAWAVKKEITNGYGSSDTFATTLECPHTQILTFLWRAENKPAASVKAPVTVAAYYQDAINWACEKGLIDDSFNPDALCTRAQAVWYIWKVLNEPSAPASSFADMGGYEKYAKAVSWAVESGVTNGYGNSDTFAPGRVCSRGEIAAFLYRAYNI